MKLQCAFIFYSIFLCNNPMMSQPKTVQEADTININRADAQGRKQGLWKKFDENGKLVYKGYFKDDKPVDVMKHYYPDGKLKSDMIFYDNNRAASVHHYYENGTLKASGIYRNEERDSVWRFYYRDGKLSAEEAYTAGIRNGVSKTYYPNGTLTEEKHYVKGTEHGLHREYFENGKLKNEMNVVMGKFHGTEKTWYPSGKLYSTGIYRNNLSDSSWTFYNEDGSILYIRKYKDGILLNAEEIQKKEEEIEKENSKKGIIRQYKEGEIKEDTLFKNTPFIEGE